MLQDVALQYVNGIPTFPGQVAAQGLQLSGPAAGPPTTGTAVAGQLGTDSSGSVWLCTAGGSPGTWVNADQGFDEQLIAPTGTTGQTCPRCVATGTSASTLTSGTVYGRVIPLRAGIPVSNITLYTAAGNVVTQANLTHGWYALLDLNRNVLTVSADQINVAFLTVINTPYPLAVRGNAGAIYTTTYTGYYIIAESTSVSALNMPQFAVSGSVGVGVGSDAPVVQGTMGTQVAPPAIGAQLGAMAFSNNNAFYGRTT